jgi:tetratricopeptide (TPR) repeat protein
MYCSSCGEKIPEDSVFCPECGVPVSEEDTSAPEKDTPAPKEDASAPEKDTPAPKEDAPVSAETLAPPEPNKVTVTPEVTPEVAVAAEPSETAAATGSSEVVAPTEPNAAAVAAEPSQTPPPPPPLPNQAVQPPAPSFQQVASPVVAQQAPPYASPQFSPTGQVAPGKKQKKVKQPGEKKKRTPLIIAVVVAAVLIIAGGSFGIFKLVQSNNYQAAVELQESGTAYFSTAVDKDDYSNALNDYSAASEKFTKLGDYKDASSRAAACQDQSELCQRYMDYCDARTSFEAGDYEGAKTAFEALGNFEDAEELVVLCQQNIDYKKAVALYDAGKYTEALPIFQELESGGFAEADGWVDKTNYGIADDLFKAGSLYEAWGAFTQLGDYEDSAARAAACTTPFPATGEIYHNEGFVSSAATVKFVMSASLIPYYIKIYSGDTLVVSLFLNVGTDLSIELPAGTYVFKASRGATWFGEDVKFGKEGSYYTMLLQNDQPNTTLENNYIYTLTMQASNGNVGQQKEDPDGF